jgi:hypothetical protein
MTTAEFKDELNVIYENINKNGAPGLDDYEISVILTHAQEMFLRAMVAQDPSANEFPALISVVTITGPTTSGIDSGYSFNIPSDWMILLDGKVLNTSGDELRVRPISSDVYAMKLSKPYSYPPRRTAWRLPQQEGSNTAAEIRVRPGFIPTTYRLRYLRKPTPIIVTNLAVLTPPASIDGLTAVTECEFSVQYHREILKFAATLAEQYYMDKYETTDGNK